MIVKDSVFGEFEIKEPVLIELINSKAIQRLKNISQVGVPDRFYFRSSGNRFEHSIGVLYLLRKLNASIEEQVSGLLHDVSHTAFSHVADWVFGSSENEDFQDNIHLDILHGPEILSILEKYNLDVKRIGNFENFTLLDREIPDLCIDRLDYSMRDFLFDKSKISFLLSSLINRNNKVVFNSREAAKIFGEEFLKCQTEHWASADAVIRYYVLAKALKIALDEKIIAEEDFRKDDDFIIEKLESSNNEKIKEILKYLEEENLEYNLDDENPQISAKKKFRYVDPEYLEKGVLKRLSQENEDFRNLIEKERKINEKKTNVTLPLTF